STSNGIDDDVGGPDTEMVVKSNSPSVGYVSAPAISIMSWVTPSISTCSNVSNVGPGDWIEYGVGMNSVMNSSMTKTVPTRLACGRSFVWTSIYRFRCGSIEFS